MGPVLWIDQNTFATSLLEKVFKNRSLELYTLSHVNDFAYLVEDLRPVLIVLDNDTFQKNTEVFLNQYQQSKIMQESLFVIIDPRADFSFLQNKMGEIKRPFDPFIIPDILISLIKKN